ncbi:MAG: Rieske 2Fe-2S domain-containing protein [Halieaceae bacterium]|jgi:nitrite reductase/ring-hydroxylating ferredoxin subunit|nr:Rieske 2Fe-2S domain-containing protein [Halieaceae bacterium]
MSFIALARLRELDDGFRRVVSVGGRDLLLIHSAGGTYLVDRHCPHAGSALDRARVEAACITCPRHGISFDLHSGRALQGRCTPLPRYALSYDGDRVGVDL